MSTKAKIFAAAAALTLVGGIGVAGMLPANAATTRCGHNCIDVFNRLYGTNQHPAFVLDVQGRTDSTGTPVVLGAASDRDPGEDFRIVNEAKVNDFFDVVSAAVWEHYRNDLAFELEYTPNGAATGQCVGVPSIASYDTKVSLQPCGVNGGTIWIVDSSQTITDSDSYLPLVAGSSTDFIRPSVLTYPVSTHPSYLRPEQLQTGYLAASSSAEGSAGQLWGSDVGALPRGWF